MLGKRIIVNVITFILLSAMMITLLVVQLFKVDPKYTVTATFAGAGGVFTGQEVTYRGVTVGRIGDLKISRQGVDIPLVIQKKFDQIPSAATARVMFKSAVGEQFVDLLPDNNLPPYLVDGSKILIERTQLPVQQEDLLRLLDKVLAGVPPEAFSNLVNTLGAGLADRGPALSAGLRALEPLAAVANRRAGNINSLARGADRAGAAFDSTSGDFVEGIANLADVAESLSNASPAVESLLQSGQRYLPTVSGLIALRKQQIDETIAALATVTRIAAPNLLSVSDLLDWLPLFVGMFGPMYDGNYYRFGQVNGESQNPPCRYRTDEFPAGVPQRPPSASGSASYQPITKFECLPSSGPESNATTPKVPAPIVPSGEPTKPPAPTGWLDVLVGSLGL